MTPSSNASATSGMRYPTRRIASSRPFRGGISLQPKHTWEVRAAGARLHCPEHYILSDQDGVNLATACMGRGLPLVRTATWFNHLEYDWQSPLRAAFLRVLVERFQVVRYEGRGSGLSDRNVSDISFATFEQDLETVVDALGLSQYARWWFAGAATAIAHAARYPRSRRWCFMERVLWGEISEGRPRTWRRKGPSHLTHHGRGDEHSAFLRMYSLLYFPGGSAQQIKELWNLQRMATSPERSTTTYGQ